MVHAMVSPFEWPFRLRLRSPTHQKHLHYSGKTVEGYFVDLAHKLPCVSSVRRCSYHDEALEAWEIRSSRSDEYHETDSCLRNDPQELVIKQSAGRW